MLLSLINSAILTPTGGITFGLLLYKSLKFGLKVTSYVALLGFDVICNANCMDNFFLRTYKHVAFASTQRLCAGDVQNAPSAMRSP